MLLTDDEKQMLAGDEGPAVQRRDRRRARRE
jgi:hypothetical protein